MTLGQRRLLYLSFICLFVVSGGALLFYLQGYRVNVTKWRVERTGAIQADSVPADATILINGQIINETTSTTILSLPPADYEVALTLAGWQPWQKNLSVGPSAVTFTGQVRLWPATNSGQALSIDSLAEALVSPNGENLLYLTKPSAGSELWLLNLRSGQTRLLTRTAAAIIYLEWHLSNREILTQERTTTQTSWRIFNLETNTWQDLLLPDDLAFNTLHWGETRDLVYAATSAELYAFSRRTQGSKLIWRERLNDFRVHDGLIFGLTKNYGEAIGLKILNLNNLQTVPLSSTPTLSTNVSFLATPSTRDWLPLFDYDRHALYLLHSPLTEAEPIRTIPEVTTVSWTEDDNVVITNNFEIWLYNLTNQTLNFVERLSSTLTGAQLYADEPYILFSSSQEVWALELDERDERQRWLLAQYPHKIINMFLSPTADTLTIQTTTDLYRLELTTAMADDAEPVNSPAAVIQKFLHLSNRPGAQ